MTHNYHCKVVKEVFSKFKRVTPVTCFMSRPLSILHNNTQRIRPFRKKDKSLFISIISLLKLWKNINIDSRMYNKLSIIVNLWHFVIFVNFPIMLFFTIVLISKSFQYFLKRIFFINWNMTTCIKKFWVSQINLTMRQLTSIAHTYCRIKVFCKKRKKKSQYTISIKSQLHWPSKIIVRVRLKAQLETRGA